MKATSLRDAVLVMRAAAAYSTALKNTSDTIRHSLPAKLLEQEAEENVPEIVVTELTVAEVEELRRVDDSGDRDDRELDADACEADPSVIIEGADSE